MQRYDFNFDLQIFYKYFFEKFLIIFELIDFQRFNIYKYFYNTYSAYLPKETNRYFTWLYEDERIKIRKQNQDIGYELLAILSIYLSDTYKRHILNY